MITRQNAQKYFDHRADLMLQENLLHVKKVLAETNALSSCNVNGLGQKATLAYCSVLTNTVGKN